MLLYVFTPHEGGMSALNVHHVSYLVVDAPQDARPDVSAAIASLLGLPVPSALEYRAFGPQWQKTPAAALVDDKDRFITELAAKGFTAAFVKPDYVTALQ